MFLVLFAKCVVFFVIFVFDCITKYISFLFISVYRVIEAFQENDEEALSELNDSDLLEVWKTPPESLGTNEL